MRFFRGAGLWIAAVLSLHCAPANATHYWELSPVSDPRVAIGSYTVVGGKTSPDGVNFTLKDNSDTQPVALTLIAMTQGAPLHLSAFKDDGESFLDKDTDATGRLTIRFRTADTMDFKVAGAVGSAYQLALWRGPAIAIPPRDSIVAMDAVTGHAENANAPLSAKAASEVAAPSNSAQATSPPIASNLLIYILLAGILVALVAIAFLVYRGQKMRGKS